jgi:hypothetical protein
MTPTPLMEEGAHGVKVLLMGPTGTGKTFSLQTLLETGLDVYCVFLEQNYEEVTKHPEVKWMYIPAANPSWADLIDSARKINTLSNESLQKLVGINRSAYCQFIDLLNGLCEFKDRRTGKTYGDVSSWGPDKVLAIDNLSGISIMSRNLAVGSKPIMTQPDWGVSMDNIKKFIDKCVYDLACHFILLAHVEPEKDEVTGSIKNMVSTLGRKLAPVIPPGFTDSILAVREGTSFYWSTADSRTDLKAIHLPVQDKIQPSFVPLIRDWAKKTGYQLPTGR